ncbi:cleavage stimulating factor 64 [Lactuca sativa]|uniref:RRM domain-containing protein n=1 Tax=Lactuca sativa TaxID=4236 RepID=A0A9R1WPX0_LACSA|nr:cleavage stimulating factor 64 [Lactuca sativa]KAJ0225998.1 hypothetical protein LSAT_V11C100002550 [Lactuca sativa]
MANSQHRCVFVGNIPYDATEEQLREICEEVGPVVSFRLVVDRETGKPKGYGFCEYQDEETALSARRNLHGYDINGRQLRVDFAENDKNNERSKEQGRGGPGMATNTAPQKQIGGPAGHGDPSVHQSFGVQDAMAAAIVMAGALGGGQNGIRSQPIPGTDPLTLHLAKMSNTQLTEVLTEVKALATQNKEQARQLFLANPQLSKAVLQAHIMLKTVPPQLLHMAGIGRQVPGPVAQQSGAQPLSGLLLPPLAQNKMPLGFIMPQAQSQSQSSHSSVPTHYATSSVPLQPPPRFQTPPPHPTLLGGVSGTLQSLHPQQPSISIPTPPHSLLQDNVFKPSSSIGPSILNNGDKDHHHHHHHHHVLPLHHNVPTGGAWGHNNHPIPNNNTASKLQENGHGRDNSNSNSDQINHHPPKLLKMEDGKAAPFSPTPHMNQNHFSKPGPIDSQNQKLEVLPSGSESELLEQVMNLTAEQLSSLPPEQQQQVIQLQQMLIRQKSTY